MYAGNSEAVAVQFSAKYDGISVAGWGIVNT